MPRLKEDVDAALVSKGDLVACYVEANKLTAISDKAAAVTAFNLAEKGMTEEALADQVHIVTALYRTLQKNPSLFMRELDYGPHAPHGRMYIEEEARITATASGCTKKTRTSTRPLRSGNLADAEDRAVFDRQELRPGHRRHHGFRGAGTGEINDVTPEVVEGATVDELLFSLTLRPGVLNPFEGLFAGRQRKVWFVKRATDRSSSTRTRPTRQRGSTALER